MGSRIAHHVRANVVAYLALVVGVLSGGGFALAATRSTTIHACVVRRTGELLVRAKCARGESRISWNEQGPAGATGATGATGPMGEPGASPFVASGEVGPTGASGIEGLTSQQTGTGQYLITLTGPGCPNHMDNLVASVNGDPIYENGSVAISQVGLGNGSNQFIVSTATVSSGAVTLSNISFDVIGTC